MLRRNVYEEDWIPDGGAGVAGAAGGGCSGGLYSSQYTGYTGRRPCIKSFQSKRPVATIYHDKLMFLLEDLARSERTDPDPRHRIEYSRARKRAIDLYKAGKDPDPRQDLYNLQFPAAHTLEDEMYGCSDEPDTDEPEVRPSDGVADGVVAVTDVPALSDPLATPSGMHIPVESSTWDMPGDVGYHI